MKSSSHELLFRIAYFSRSGKSPVTDRPARSFWPPSGMPATTAAQTPPAPRPVPEAAAPDRPRRSHRDTARRPKNGTAPRRADGALGAAGKDADGIQRHQPVGGETMGFGPFVIERVEGKPVFIALQDLFLGGEGHGQGLLFLFSHCKQADGKKQGKSIKTQKKSGSQPAKSRRGAADAVRSLLRVGNLG
mgnify:CR=1 FL=1